MKNIPEGMFCNGCPCMDVNMNNRHCRIFSNHLKKESMDVWKCKQCLDKEPKIVVDKPGIAKVWDELKMKKIREKEGTNGEVVRSKGVDVCTS